MNKWLLPSTDNKYLINFLIDHKYGICFSVMYNNKGKLMDVEIQQLI